MAPEKTSDQPEENEAYNPASLDEILSDKDLWHILQVQPPVVRDVWSEKSAVGKGWLIWAKLEILSAANCAPFIYLLRVLRIMNSTSQYLDYETRHLWEEHGFEYGFFRSCVLGGYAACNTKCDDFDRLVDLAEMEGHITLKKADTHWKPGARSGSGWRTYIRLAFAGKKQVDRFSLEPDLQAEEYVPQQGCSPVPTKDPCRAASSKETPVCPRPWEKLPEASTRIQESTTRYVSATTTDAQIKAEARIGDIHININLPAGSTIPLPEIHTQPDASGVTTKAEKKAVKKIRLQDCRLVLEPLRKSVDLVQAVGGKQTEMLFNLASGSQPKRYEFFSDVMDSATGCTARTNRDTIKNIRNAMEEACAEKNLQVDGDIIQNEGKDQYRLMIPLLASTEDYKPDHHLKLGDIDDYDLGEEYDKEDQ